MSRPLHILKRIAGWFGRQVILSCIDRLIRFLSRVPGWIDYVANLAHHTVQWALQELESLRPRIIDEIQLSEDEFYACTTAIKAGSKFVAKNTGTTVVALSTFKVLTTTTFAAAAKAASEVTTKQMLKTAAKCTTGMVGIVASDILQAGLEMSGHKNTGKAVGAAGNVISGAMTGFMIAGPPGAAIGGAAGFGVWAAGEYVGMFTSEVIDAIKNRIEQYLIEQNNRSY